MNTQITISNIEQNIVDKLILEANKNGKDLNTYLIFLLKNSIGFETVGKNKNSYDDLDSLAGSWSKEDFEDFISITSDFRTIDEDLWK